MCIIIPSKIIKIHKNQAQIKQGQHVGTVDISLISDIKTGNYILEHAGFAIKKVPTHEAKQLINLIRKL